MSLVEDSALLRFDQHGIRPPYPKKAKRLITIVDSGRAIRWENGPHIICHWKWWLPLFLSTGCSNYASEAVHLIVNLTADFPKHSTCNTQQNS